MARDPLEDLLDQVMGHTVKKQKIPDAKPIKKPAPQRIYFDADRFRFYFDGRNGLSLQQWRDVIDEEMRHLEEP